VLQWFCDDETRVSVRPSGTEPKIKFYIEVKGVMHSPKDYKALDREGMQKIEAIKKSLNLK
jgi:phosphoglucomutase